MPEGFAQEMRRSLGDEIQRRQQSIHRSDFTSRLNRRNSIVSAEYVTHIWPDFIMKTTVSVDCPGDFILTLKD
jgi:hypothetical protein